MFHKLMDYIRHRRWEDRKFPVRYPLAVSRGDTLEINGRSYLVSSDQKFQTEAELRAYEKIRSR